MREVLFNLFEREKLSRAGGMGGGAEAEGADSSLSRESSVGHYPKTLRW